MADSRGNNLSFYRAFISQIQLRSFPLCLSLSFSLHAWIYHYNCTFRLLAQFQCSSAPIYNNQHFSDYNCNINSYDLRDRSLRFIRYRRNFNYRSNFPFLNFSRSINYYFFYFLEQTSRYIFPLFIAVILFLASLRFIAIGNPYFGISFITRTPFFLHQEEGSNNDGEVVCRYFFLPFLNLQEHTCSFFFNFPIFFKLILINSKFQVLY